MLRHIMDVISLVIGSIGVGIVVYDAIVAIRSVISFFLNKELKEGHDCVSEGVRSLPSKLAKAKRIL